MPAASSRPKALEAEKAYGDALVAARAEAGIHERRGSAEAFANRCSRCGGCRVALAHDVDRLGLSEALSSQRSNGLKAMVNRIQTDAVAALG